MGGSTSELHNLDDDSAVLAQAFVTTVLRISKKKKKKNPHPVVVANHFKSLHLLQLAALFAAGCVRGVYSQVR